MPRVEKLYFALSLSVATSGCLSSPSPTVTDASAIDAAVADAGPVIDAGPAIDAGPVIDARVLPTCDGVGPVQVRQLAAGGEHTCAVLTNGLVHCWGVGGAGRLGYGHTENIGDDDTPTTAGPVDLGSACAVQVAAGGAHTCVLLEGGGVRCWGRAAAAELGVPPGANVTSPPAEDIPFTALAGATIVQVAAGSRHTCVRLDDGNVRCFGSNDRGQIGHLTITLAGALATNVDIGGSAMDISAGEEHTCVRFDDGSTKCWGAGDNGKLGFNGLADVLPSAGSALIATGGTVTAVSAGNEHTCAVLNEAAASGVVRCWGRGIAGRLGNLDELSVGDTEAPATISALDFGAPATQIRAGGFHTCALVDSHVRCWGDGISGQLGYADTNDNIGDSLAHPLRGDLVTGIEPIAQVVTGREHTCALANSGRVRCWGRPNEGRLGHGDGRSVGNAGAPIAAGGDVPVWCDDDTVPCD